MRDEYKLSLSLFSYHALTEDPTGLLYVYFCIISLDTIPPSPSP